MHRFREQASMGSADNSSVPVNDEVTYPCLDKATNKRQGMWDVET